MMIRQKSSDMIQSALVSISGSINKQKTTDERRAEPFIGGFALGWDDNQRSPRLYSIKMRMGMPSKTVGRWLDQQLA